MKINGKEITPERLIEIALPRHADQIKKHMREVKIKASDASQRKQG